jgi:hypothetical protein
MNNQQNRTQGLNALLRQDAAANAYFSHLPDYVRDMISQRSDNIRSADELRHYAESLLAGDR